MGKIACLALLFPFLCLGQGVAPPSGGGTPFSGSYASFTATAADGANAFIMKNEGALLCLNGAACTSYIADNDVSHGVIVQTNNGATGNAFVIAPQVNMTSGAILLAQDVNGDGLSLSGNGLLTLTGSGSSLISLPNGKSIDWDNSGQIKESVTTSTMSFRSGVANSGSNNAFLFNTVGTLSGSTNLFDFQNNTTSELSLTRAGLLTAQGNLVSATGNIKLGASNGAFQGSNTVNFNATGGGEPTTAFKFTMDRTYSNASSKLVSVQNFTTEVAYFGINGDLFSATANPVPSVHATSHSTAQSFEYGTDTLSTGAVVHNFGTAFANAPICLCQEQSSVLAAKCTATTSAVTVTVTGGASDTVTFLCAGDR